MSFQFFEESNVESNHNKENRMWLSSQNNSCYYMWKNTIDIEHYTAITSRGNMWKFNVWI